tara:strand:+ start:320 stop:787 length:468 start_codon:yes stop_codon:yes gene_type:complete
MKITVDISDDYIDDETIEEGLRDIIISKVTHALSNNISEKCINSINKKVKETVIESVFQNSNNVINSILNDSKFDITIDNEELKGITAEKAVHLLFVKQLERNYFSNFITLQADKISKELKERYDSKFAMLIVENLNKNNMLAEGVEKLILKGDS